MNSTADIPCYSLVVLETVIAVTAVIAAGCCLSDSAAEELIVGDAWCIESKVESCPSQVSSNGEFPINRFVKDRHQLYFDGNSSAKFGLLQGLSTLITSHHPATVNTMKALFIEQTEGPPGKVSSIPISFSKTID